MSRSRLSVCLSVHPSVRMSVFLSIHLPVLMSVCPMICVHVWLFFRPHVRSTIWVCVTVHPYVCPHVCPSICLLSACLCICSFFRLYCPSSLSACLPLGASLHLSFCQSLVSSLCSSVVLYVRLFTSPFVKTSACLFECPSFYLSVGPPTCSSIETFVCRCVQRALPSCLFVTVCLTNKINQKRPLVSGCCLCSRLFVHSRPSDGRPSSDCCPTRRLKSTAALMIFKLTRMPMNRSTEMKWPFNTGCTNENTFVRTHTMIRQTSFPCPEEMTMCALLLKLLFWQPGQYSFATEKGNSRPKQAFVCVTASALTAMPKDVMIIYIASPSRPPVPQHQGTKKSMQVTCWTDFLKPDPANRQHVTLSRK